MTVLDSGDPKVLDAQIWVNQTYGDVAGFESTPENGRTGWPVMRSLILGLQHELGIVDIVPTFGPSTEERVRALGPINPGWDANENIVRIVQHALFCKGYWGGNIYGMWDSKTTSSLVALRTNMGLPDGITQPDPVLLPAEVFKGLLNMDAYTVLSGGTEKVRSIQQWLNGGYWDRSAFDIGPCDGIYSRSVQQALMVALQYELGLAAPNGNFGPGTQAGLRANTLSMGDTGIFVELFSAACVFNEPVPPQGTRSNQRSIFDAQLAEFVEEFQAFSQLEINGMGDYQTWAQLLVSMGDPDRPVTGCDTRFEITPTRAEWLVANGYEAIGRYINDPPGSTLDKDIKPGELDVIFDADLRVMPIFQENARLYEDFTYSSGFSHALEAHDLAASYGFNRGTVIYFAVDYDATQQAIDSAIIPYFNGIRAGLSNRGGRYIHGVYGSRNVCINVTEQCHARYSFVSSMSWGFSGNLGFPLPANWSFNQIKEWRVTDVADPFDLDNNAWRKVEGDPGQSSVNRPSRVAEEFIQYIRELYQCAQDYDQGDPNELVMQFIRSAEYSGGEWLAVLGPIDQGFVDYARGQGFDIIPEFTDPVTGYEIGTDHLMATCNGVYSIGDPAKPEIANASDVTGWGGDLMTFYRDWRDFEEQYASGYEFAVQNLAVPGVTSSFGYSDLIEDADAYNLAQMIDSGSNIANAVASYYASQGDSRQRFTNYLDGRFRNESTAEEAALYILTDQLDPVIIAAQHRFMFGTIPPSLLPSLKSFTSGFAHVLAERAGLE